MTHSINDIESRRLTGWTMLLCGVSALSLTFASPVLAQEAPVSTTQASEEDDEEARQDTVVVRGIRSQIESAQEIKRSAETFVDAVTAEDIGALPDRSVTEALQRVPGITISRFAAADDPDHFSIEGAGVVVRGLTYVRSELNGRDTFSANNGRALGFSDVSPELLGSVQVFKNQTADLIEGGLAGTINLVTRKPFDQADRMIAGTLEYNYADFREEWSPTASGLFSDRFDLGEAGEIGVLLNVVYSELNTRSDGTQASSFQPRTDIPGFVGTRVFIPEGAALRTQDYDRERLGYGGSLQWQNPDRTLIATAEFLRSEATTSWGERAVEIATDNVGDTAFGFLPGTQFGFNSDNLFTNGVISAPLGWRSDQNTPAAQGGRRTPVYGLQSNNISRSVEQENVTSDASFNLKWSPNDKWAFNADYQFVDSTVTNVDFGLWGTTFQDVSLDLNHEELPEVLFYRPNITGFAGNPALDCSGGFGNSGGCPSYFAPPNDSFAAPANSFWRAAMDHLEESEGQEQAFRADAEYKFDDGEGWLRSVRAGVRWAERDQTTRFSTYNWGALSEIWGNNGPVWFDEVGVPQGVVGEFSWDNFQRGSVEAPPTLLFYNVNAAQNYNATADFADQVVAQWLANGGNTGGAQGGAGGWRRLAERPGVVAGTPYLPGEINPTLETTQSAYAMLRFGNDNPFGNGITIDGNIGVRFVSTEFEATGFIQFPESSTLPVDTGAPGPAGPNRCVPPTDLTPGQEFNPPAFCALPADQRAAAQAFANAALIQAPFDTSYDHVLPSFNLKIGLNEDMIIRAAYSKGISRPDLGLMRGNFTISPITTADDPRTTEVEGPPPGFTGGFHGFQASGGNPALEPVEADNFDLAFEWYFAKAGSFTASLFYKEITNIVLTGQGSVSITNPDANVTNDVFIVNQPSNSNGTGKVKGLELSYQQFYDFLPQPFDGFGSQATITLLESEGVQSGNVSPVNAVPVGGAPTVDLAQLPLQGLSEFSYNVAGIYEKGPISARLAWNWRDEYLVTPRDVITPFYPIFQEASGQLDGSLFYTVNEQLRVGVQGANLLNEITKTTSFIPNSGGLQGGRSWFQNDRRITVSARFKF